MIDQNYFVPQLKNQNFHRYEIGGEISIAVLVYILYYFQDKLMTNFDQEFQLLCFGSHFRIFSPIIWPNKNFPGCSDFLNILIIYHRAKNN